MTTLALAGFCAVAYWRSHTKDPGLTSETALLLAALLGGLAQHEIAIASGIAVVVTILLAARAPLHHFVRTVLSQQELTDALIFVAAVLVVLPLTRTATWGRTARSIRAIVAPRPRDLLRSHVGKWERTVGSHGTGLTAPDQRRVGAPSGEAQKVG